MPRSSSSRLRSLAQILHDLSGINHLLPKVTQQIVAGEPVAMFALEAERDRRQPEAGERMLLNPETSEPMTRPRLYHRMMTLGKRAGVPEAHPHRFRDGRRYGGRGSDVCGKRRRLGENRLRDYYRAACRNPENPTKTLDNKNFSGGRACKPETSSTSLPSISSIESTNAHRQYSQFWQPKQVLCHSYGTVSMRVLSGAVPRKARQVSSRPTAGALLPHARLCYGRRGRGAGDVASRRAVSRQRQGRRTPAPVAAA